jgi:hypothetical protein
MNLAVAPPRRPTPPGRGSLVMFASPLLAFPPRKRVLAVLDDMDRNQRRGS